MIRNMLLIVGAFVAGCGTPQKDDPYYHQKFPARFERRSKAVSLFEVDRYVDDMRKDGWAIVGAFPAGDDQPNQRIVLLERPVYDGN